RAAMPSVSLMGQGNAARRKDFLLEGGHCAIIGIFFSAANNDYPAASSGVSKDIASGCLVAPRGGEYNPKRFKGGRR
ncbi:MAG: hypothetical protein ABSC19_15165, partial [Syntrophorhabdales bacterium]